MCIRDRLYDRILDLKPNSPEILYGKAVCYNAMGLPEKSLLILDELDEKFSNETNVLIARGNSHLLFQEFDIALEYYQKALEKNTKVIIKFKISSIKKRLLPLFINFLK